MDWVHLLVLWLMNLGKAKIEPGDESGGDGEKPVMDCRDNHFLVLKNALKWGGNRRILKTIRRLGPPVEKIGREGELVPVLAEGR